MSLRNGLESRRCVTTRRSSSHSVMARLMIAQPSPIHAGMPLIGMGTKTSSSTLSHVSPCHARGHAGHAGSRGVTWDGQQHVSPCHARGHAGSRG
eukprot:2676093-Prymnesium_polylepis.1